MHIYRHYIYERTGIIVMLVIIGLILAACSSSGTHTHTQSATTTKATNTIQPRSTTTKPVGTVPASFATQANAICGQAIVKIRSITPPATSPSATSPSATAAQTKVIATYLDNGIPILSNTLERLKALPVPSSAAGTKLQELYRIMSSLIQELTVLAGDYQSGNLAQAAKIEKSVSTDGSSFNSGMASMGLHNCADL